MRSKVSCVKLPNSNPSSARTRENSLTCAKEMLLMNAVLLLCLNILSKMKKMSGFKIKTKASKAKRMSSLVKILENLIWLPRVTKKMTAKKSLRDFTRPVISML